LPLDSPSCGPVLVNKSLVKKCNVVVDNHATSTSMKKKEKTGLKLILSL